MLNEVNIISFKFSFLFYRINSSLFYLIIYLPIFITSSIPLYAGEYTGVYVYMKPSSSILSLVPRLLWNDKLSIISIILSKGYLSLNDWRNILNFYVFTDFSNTSMCSIPRSLDIANNIALAGCDTYFRSTSALCFGRVQTRLGKVYFVTRHSSSYTILKFLSIALLTSWDKSSTYKIIFSFDGLSGNLVNLICFFLILYFSYICLSL